MVGRQRSRAFSIVELLIVVAVIGLLAALAIASYGKARMNSRDSRRKTDTRAIEAAIEKYRITSGTYVISFNGQKAGVDGNGYGQVNNATYAGATITMAGALSQGGYLVGNVKDPVVTGAVAMNNRDYVVVRCTAKGAQVATAADSELFAVWAKLEGQATAVEQENAGNYCGAKPGSWDFGSTNVKGPAADAANAARYFSAAPGPYVK